MAMASDPSSDTGNASSKQPWSQIVRCKDAESAPKKPFNSCDAEQIPTPASHAKDQVPMMAASPPAGIIRSGPEPFSSAGARVLDEVSVEEEGEIVEGFKAAGDGNAATADKLEVRQNKSSETSNGDAGDVSAWRRPVAATEGGMNPQPVMGATSWPALTEARNMKKNSEIRKSKSSPLQAPQMAPTASLQESLSKVSLHSGDAGPGHQQGVGNKLSAGIVKPQFQPIENGSRCSEHPALGAHGLSEQPIKHNTHPRTKGNYSANPPMDTDRVHHHRNDGAGPFHNNNRKWRNNPRDQGRGWHHCPRAYENSDDVVPLHQQRVGPRNMPRPQPFMNMNPGFYAVPHFQTNGMYFMAPGAREFVHGPTYYPMPPPPAGVIPPDPFPLRSAIIKQVDYYFSIGNLCTDFFLRTHMDEEGFVPVSLIAQFNRIRSLSSNSLVVLEALRHSDVVEVQHGKIRRRHDRGKWRMMQDQVHAAKTGQKNASVGHASQQEPEQSHDGKLVSSDDKNRGSALEQADAAHASAPCDRLNSMGDCKEIKGKMEHEKFDDDKFSGTDVSTHLCGRDGSKEENAVCTTLVDETAGCQSFQSTRVREEPTCTHRAEAENQQSCSGHSWFLEGRARPSQGVVDGKPVCWNGAEGFWMENSPYFVHGGVKQSDTQAKESNFILKSHKDGDEHPEEVNNRKLDRPIKVSHTSLGSLGSYIAVP